MPIPNKSGYYWRTGRNEDDEVVTQVVEVGPLISTMPNELFYWTPGDIGAIYVGADSEWDTEWHGPIMDASMEKVIIEDMTSALDLILQSGLQVESITDGIKLLLQGAQHAPIIEGGLDDKK